MSKSILVAEDAPDVRKIMKLMLERFGYRVFEAADGFEAVQIVEREVPDLILMDMAMPVMDGVQAANAIRNLDHKTPILCITAFSDRYHDQALAAGCDAVIKKPLNLDRLRPLVEQYLN